MLQAFNDWEHNSYKIRLNEKRKQILDIPPASRSLRAYSATLAHKVRTYERDFILALILQYLTISNVVSSLR